MTQRDRILLMIVGPLGLLLLFYFFIYAPKQAEYQQLRAQLEQQEAVLHRMEETARQITRLREEFARLQAFIAEVETKLPAEKDMPALLVQLERLARSLFINLESIRPSALEQATPSPGGAAKAQPAAPSYLRFPINLTIKGTYDQVIRLATALNDFPRMIAIRDISLSPVKLPELNWNVNVETYVLPRGAR
jgi:Tfp pilus assembly protein PilO